MASFVLRWIVVFPVSLIVGLFSQALYTLIFSAVIPSNDFTAIWLRITEGIILGFVPLFVGHRIAPNHKLGAVWALAVLGFLWATVGIILLIGQEKWIDATSIIGFLGATAYGIAHLDDKSRAYTQPYTKE